MTTDGMFALYESHVVSGDGSLRPLSYLTGTSIEKKLRARAETEPCTFMHVLQLGPYLPFDRSTGAAQSALHFPPLADLFIPTQTQLLLEAF